jgi:hypothetical protein
VLLTDQDIQQFLAKRAVPAQAGKIHGRRTRPGS